MLFLMNAEAQWTSKRANNWWSQTEASLDNIFSQGLADSTLTVFIIGNSGDTVKVRGNFKFWRTNRYVPQDSVVLNAQMITYVTGLGYLVSVDIADINATGTPTGSNFLRGDGTWSVPSGAGDMLAATYDVDSDDKADVDTTDVLGLARTAAYQSKDSSLIDVTGSGKFIMGNAGSGWYEATTQQAKDTLGIPALERAIPDTLSFTWGVMDTTTVGALPGWKVPFNITIIELSAYTDANTCTFNIEERAETTPNTAGTDIMGSELVADNDQQETATFSNAAIDKNDWLVPTISATGDVSIFSITVRYVKTN